jgi:hypothetical protein
MKTHSLKTTCFLTSLAALLFFATSCKTASFETTWPNETNTWKVYSLNGIEFKIPTQLPRMQLNSDTLWFVIKAKQVDNFSEGVRKAISIRCVSLSAEAMDSATKRAVENIKSNGGRVYFQNKPTNSILYYNPNATIKPQGGTASISNSLVTGSSFGYTFKIKENSLVQVSFFNIDHTPIPYEKWNPESDVFSESERQLVEKIAISVQ